MATRKIGRKTTQIKKSLVKKTTPAKRKTVAIKRTGAAASIRAKRTSPGGIARVKHFDFSAKTPFKFNIKKIKTDIFKKAKSAPSNIEISLEPKENDHIVYHPTPGFTSLEENLAQLSVRAILYNKGTSTVDLDRVVLEYKKGNQTVKKDIYLPSDQLIIDPGYAWAWQNSRPYHESGDVVFLDAPFPTSIKLSFYFKGYLGSIALTNKLKPYDLGLAFPFDDSDFEKDEHVVGYSMHGGGDQVFAYDLGVQGYKNQAWRDLHPGKDWSKNDHYRIWGKPIRAMADGKVMHFENKVPNNWFPATSDAQMKKQKDDLWGGFDYGGSGNHFYIKHGNVVALYAHMQKGSLTKKFLKNGATVKKGDVLGKAGNSGNSSGPHLHIHIKTYTNANDPEAGAYRPLLFNTSYVIGQAKYPKPKSNINWSKLNTEGIPGLKSKACFISSKHPYCEYPTNWGEVCRFGVHESKYQEEFDKVWTCGYYPIWVDGYNVNNNTYFNVIFRSSKDVAWVARHHMGSAKYQTEFDKWAKAGYRLININSYLLNGYIRYAAVWKKDSSVKWFAYHGKSLAWHESNFAKYMRAGWVPTNVSCVDVNGKIYVTALWEKKKTGGFYLKPVLTLQEFVAAFDQYTNKQKFKLVYLDGFVRGGKPRLSAIWYKNQPNYNSWWEKYNLTATKFQSEYNTMLGNGYLTRVIAGYQHGNGARFEGIWSK